MQDREITRTEPGASRGRERERSCNRELTVILQKRAYATFDNRAALAQTLHMIGKPQCRKPDAPKPNRRNRALLFPIGGSTKPRREAAPPRKTARREPANLARYLWPTPKLPDR
jgi:hypothetical protein